MILRLILKMITRLHNDDGDTANEYVMESCGGFQKVRIEAGRWHLLEVMDEWLVPFENKVGA